VELTALAAGLRRIVKFDGVPPELVDGLRETAAERGLHVALVRPPGTMGDRVVTVLVADDRSALVEARGLETLLLAPGDVPGVGSATQRMGALLGYPSCCVERFTRIAEQNDTTLAWALLPGIPHPAASALTQWLQPGLALLSHAPCDLHCAASIALGEHILHAVEANDSGFTARWRSLAARVQVVDQRGTRIALAANGRLETGATVTAADVLASGASDPEAGTRAQALVGRTVSADSGGLVVTEGDWCAPYAADHRGRLSPPA
jgi:hypothetical protein